MFKCSCVEFSCFFFTKIQYCTKPALKFCSYGGFVCSSCRSFFRRSIKKKNYPICRKAKVCNIDPGTRINCRHFRFQLCMRSGMTVSWVLSEQEKGRRFKKTKKENIPQLFRIPFSPLEENIMVEVMVWIIPNGIVLCVWKHSLGSS
jgi:hypothetical protein